jgi:hypothetical protein
MKYLEIETPKGTQSIPFAFSYRCMRELLSKHDMGSSTSRLIDDVKAAEDGILLGINNGRKRAQESGKMTKDELLDILDHDPTAYQKFQAAFISDMNLLQPSDTDSPGGGSEGN